MNLIKKVLAILLIIGPFAYAADVRILPLRGPMGSVNVDVPNGSAIGYEMDVRGQKAICVKNFQSTTIYIGSSTVDANNGYPLFNQGDVVCMDLTHGTTIYLFGTAASQKARILIAK